MHKRAIVIIALLIGLMIIPSAVASTNNTTTLASLSSQSSLAPQTTYNSDGSYVTSTVALDNAATTATVGTDSFLCGNVQYRATVKAYDFWGFVVWTYRSTFGVHVCNNKVQSKTALYDEPMDSNFGWSWCGHILNHFTMNPNNASAIGYTKGCFTVLVKGLVQTKYPWASMTIGGNGGLWVRNTGGN